MRRLQAYAQRLSPHWEDYLQECFVRVLLRKPEYPFRYLIKAVRNHHMDNMRTAQRQVMVRDFDFTALEDEAYQTRPPDIYTMLARVSVDERDILIAKLSGIAYRDIAERAGMEVRAVRRIINQIKEKCTEDIE